MIVLTSRLMDSNLKVELIRPAIFFAKKWKEAHLGGLKSSLVREVTTRKNQAKQAK